MLGNNWQPPSAVVRANAAAGLNRRGGTNTSGSFLGIDTDTWSDIGGAAVDAFDSTWDILSGNRDRRFNREQATTAHERQRDLLRDTAGLQMEGLAAAGINPVLAGQLGGSSGSVPTAHSSGSAGAIGGALNSAVSLSGVLTSLQRTLAESRKINAEADYIQQSSPLNIDRLRLAIPETQANIALTKSNTLFRDLEADLKRYGMFEAKAGADYFKRFGWAGILGREMRNPWQTGQLAAGLGMQKVDAALQEAPSFLKRLKDARGAANERVDGAINSALDISTHTLRRAAEASFKQTQRYDDRKAPVKGRRYMMWR